MNIKELLKIIACPKCRGDLRVIGSDGLLCERCGLVYPIRDDIPILLIDQAVGVADWETRGAERGERCER